MKNKHPGKQYVAPMEFDESPTDRRMLPIEYNEKSPTLTENNRRPISSKYNERRLTPVEHDRRSSRAEHERRPIPAEYNDNRMVPNEYNRRTLPVDYNENRTIPTEYKRFSLPVEKNDRRSIQFRSSQPVRYKEGSRRRITRANTPPLIDFEDQEDQEEHEFQRSIGSIELMSSHISGLETILTRMSEMNMRNNGH